MDIWKDEVFFLNMIYKDNILNLEDNFLIPKEAFSDTMMLKDDEEQLELL